MRPQPVGGIEEVDAMLRVAYRHADPQGAVLVILWSSNAPAPREVDEIAERWESYGLASMGICIDLLGPDDRESSIERIRDWERSHSLEIPSLIFDGERSALERLLQVAAEEATLILYSEHEALIWSGVGYEWVERLRTEIEDRLGPPSVA
jgi:hypothetical protein